MALYSYAIGTAMNTMVNIEDLVSALSAYHRCVPPAGLAVEPWAVYRVGADGTEYGDGYPRCTWKFSAMYQTQLDALLNYLGSAQSVSVYIRTRKVGRTYSYYKAIMHRPKPNQMTPAYGNMWHDIEVEFTMLELQADP